MVSILEAAIAATGCEVRVAADPIGADAYEKTGEYIPKVLYDSIEENRVALKGPVTTPIGEGFASINVHLRQEFELFANFRPMKNLPGLKTRYPGLDLIIVRENMEDEYVGLEHVVVPGVVQALKIITEKGSTRIAKFAFDYARKSRAQDSRNPQGEHHEAVGWPLSALLPDGREGLSRGGVLRTYCR